jgi:hypothetical protein
MKKIFVIFLLLCLITPASARQNSFVDDNAALRYLLAIGYMPDFSEDEFFKMSNLTSISAYDALNIQLKEKLGKKRFATILRLVRNASQCKNYSIIVDHDFSFDAIIPPYKTIRRFSDYLIAEAWDIAKHGDVETAAEILIHTMKLGRNLASEGPMLNCMFGVEIQRTALVSIANIIKTINNLKAKALFKDYFNSLPVPSMNFRTNIEAELKYSKNFSEVVLRRPEIIGERLFADANKTPEKSEIEKQCLSNQRAVISALDMAILDNPDLATLKSDEILNFLTAKKYLEKAPTCPRGGKFTIIFENTDYYSVKCSCGIGTDGPEYYQGKKLTAEQLEKTREYIASEQFKKDCAEANELLDEINSLKGSDGESFAKAKKINEKKKSRQEKNPMIRLAVFNPEVFMIEVRELQDKISSITVKLNK